MSLTSQSDSIQRAIHAAYNSRSAKAIVEVLLRHRLEATPRNIATGLHRLSRLRPECRQLFRSVEMNRVHACVLRHLTQNSVNPQYIANVLTACADADFTSKSLYRYTTAVLKEDRLETPFNGQELSSILAAICQPGGRSRGLVERKELVRVMIEYMALYLPTLAAPELAKLMYSIGKAYDEGLLSEEIRLKAESLIQSEIFPQMREIPHELFSPRDVAQLLWGCTLLPMNNAASLNAVLYFREHIVSLASCGGFSVKALCRLTTALSEMTMAYSDDSEKEWYVVAPPRLGRWTPEEVARLAATIGSSSSCAAKELPVLERLVETIVPFGPSASPALVDAFMASCWVLRTHAVRPSRRTSAGLLSLFRSLRDAPQLHAQVMLLCFAWGVYPTAKDFTQCAMRIKANLLNGLNADTAYMSLVAKTLAHLCFAAGWHASF